MKDALQHIAPVERQGQLLVGLNLEGRRALVVGEGREAARRARALLAAGARVVVARSAKGDEVGESFGSELEARAKRGELELLSKAPAFLDEPDARRPLDRFAREELRAFHAVVLCDREDPRAEVLVERCRSERVWVHVTDETRWCDFVFPAVHREGPLQVAIATGGVGPALAGRVRDLVRAALPPRIGDAVARFGMLRRAVRAAAPEAPSVARMAWLKTFGCERDIEELARLTDAEIASSVQAYLRDVLEDDPQGPPPGGGAPRSHAPGQHGPRAASARPIGRVQLVGAGPGHPSLMTLAAREALEEADLVLADRLVPASILEHVRGELRLARKLPGRADLAQAELEQWMIEAARAGRHVVRLKCGDPFLFGRGQEEVSRLRAAGIEPERLPGLSSALAAPLLGGIAVTERGVADRVVISTARGAAGREVDCPAFRKETTFVFLMAVGELESLSARLMRSGFPASLPVALVSRAGWDTEERLVSTLERVAVDAREAGIRPPAVFILGESVARAVDSCREGVHGRPLDGLQRVTTRPLHPPLPSERRAAGA